VGLRQIFRDESSQFSWENRLLRIAEHEGISIGISRATLNMTLEEYKATLQNIDFDDSGVRLLPQFQQLVNDVREQHGKPWLYHDESQRDLPGIVAKMQIAIFSHLKSTLDPEGTLKPQYQITLKTSDSALRAVYRKVNFSFPVTPAWSRSGQERHFPQSLVSDRRRKLRSMSFSTRADNISLATR
jgi:hypothetical protein